MPLYDFMCIGCHARLEVLRGMQEEYPSCPECGGEMAKMFSSPPMIYMKGEGGYPSRRRQIFNTTNRIHPKLT